MEGPGSWIMGSLNITNTGSTELPGSQSVILHPYLWNILAKKKKCSTEPSDELPVYGRARVSKKKNQTNQGGTFLQDNWHGLSITKNCSTLKSRDLLRCVMWSWNRFAFGTNREFSWWKYNDTGRWRQLNEIKLGCTTVWKAWSHLGENTYTYIQIAKHLEGHR